MLWPQYETLLPSCRERGPKGYRGGSLGKVDTCTATGNRLGSVVCLIAMAAEQKTDKAIDPRLRARWLFSCVVNQKILLYCQQVVNQNRSAVC